MDKIKEVSKQTNKKNKLKIKQKDNQYLYYIIEKIL